MWRDSLKFTNILTTNKQELKEGKDGNHLMSTYMETSSMYVSKPIYNIERGDKLLHFFTNATSKRIPTHCDKSGFSYMVHNIPSQAP